MLENQTQVPVLVIQTKQKLLAAWDPPASAPFEWEEALRNLASLKEEITGIELEAQ